MTQSPDASSLREEILAGENTELRKLAAAGLVPMPPEELVPIQVRLAFAADDEVARTASESLLATEERILVPLIDDTANEEVVAFFGQRDSRNLVIEAVLTRRDVDPELLEIMAPRLSPEHQELLLLRQDAIVERPTIVDELEANPGLSSYARRRIAEYREHLLPREDRPLPDEGWKGAEQYDVQEIREAFEEAEKAEAHGKAVERKMYSDAEIRALPTPIRLKLSRRAPRQLRMVLVKDQNPIIALSVLNYNQISDAEAEQVARSRTVVEDVLTAIANDRYFTRRYPVVLALVRNPKTPQGVAFRLLPRCSVRDLRDLKFDRNVSAAIREQSQRLYRMKTK